MRDPAGSGRLPGMLLAVALALLAVPVLAVRMPPLLDYPNHAARIWLLAGGAETAPASGFYAVDWSAVSTNMGIDILAALLGTVLPAGALAPLFLLAALILPPLGAALLHRAVFGGWHPWQVGIATLAWSTTFLAGFLNFQIAIGLALLAASLEPALGRRTPLAASGLRVALALLILPVHPFGVLFYAALLAGLGFGPAWRGAGTLGWRAGRGLLGALVVLVPLGLVLLLAPNPPGAHATGPAAEWAVFSLQGKLDLLLSGIRTYRRGVDLLLAGLLALPVLWALATGRLGSHAGLLLAGLALLAMTLVMPWQIRGTAWIEERFPTMALLTLAASLRPDPVVGRRALAGFTAAMLGLVAARTAVVGQVWLARQADVAAVERALAALPEGAALLPMEHVAMTRDRAAPIGRYIRGQATYWHLPVLAVAERQAFVPTLFAMRGKQPIRVLPPWNDLAVADGTPVSVSALLAERPEAYRGHWHDRQPTHHLENWRDRFDHVLVVNADQPDGEGPARPVPGLELVTDEGFARLYRVVPEGPARTAGR